MTFDEIMNNFAQQMRWGKPADQARADDAMRGLLTNAKCKYANGYPVVASGANVSVRDVSVNSGPNEPVFFALEIDYIEQMSDNHRFKLVAQPGFTMKMAGLMPDGREIWETVSLDIMPDPGPFPQSAAQPDSEPSTLSHRAPDVWARIRSL